MGVHEQQVFMVAPVDAHGEALETLHLHHAAAHGDGLPMEGAPVAACRGDAVVVGVGGPVVEDGEGHLDAFALGDGAGIGDAGIGQVDVEAPADESDVRAVPVVGFGQRAVDVEFDEDAADIPAEGLADKGAYAGCAGDVGTGRAAHDGADDVVEQACGKFCHNDSLK